MIVRLRSMGGLTCLLLLAWAASGCGGSSSSPVAPAVANVAGNWTGTIQFTQNNSAGLPVQLTQFVSLVMTQSGSTVTGTWTTTAALTPRSGAITGTTTATTFSGTFSYNTTSGAGTPCTGSLAVSGPAGGVALTWTSPAVIETCGNSPTNITFNVVKS